ncbi:MULTISPECIES: hypothetical protein [Parachlamydia]|uniref:hypothetical protein n=1 Tax=Parachlamydia TaxID=83551 RepID=UPI000750F5E0|nr:hypothetical protein [Parachlamydia acanthamoebae]
MSKKLFLKLKKQYPAFSDESLEKIYLFKKLYTERITASESVRLSYLVEMITKVQYLDYLKIERDVAEI